MSFGDVRAAVHAYLSQPIKQPDTIVAALKTCHDVAPEDALHYVTSQIGWCPASTWTVPVEDGHGIRKLKHFETVYHRDYDAVVKVGAKFMRLGHYISADAREAAVKIGELMLKAYYPADHQHPDHAQWPVLCSILETWMEYQRHRRHECPKKIRDLASAMRNHHHVGDAASLLLRAMSSDGYLVYELVRLELDLHGDKLQASIHKTPHYAKFQTMIGRVMLGGPVMLRPFVLGGGLL